MGSCFSDMEGGKQAMRYPSNRDGQTYNDAFQLILPTHVAHTQPLPSAPPPPILPAVDEEAEEQRQIAIAIMVSLEPELEQGTIAQLSFWQNEPTAVDSSSSTSTPLQRRQAKRSQTLVAATAQVPPECEYCYDAPIEATCDPCGHLACLNCWLKIQNSDNKCPRCRELINKIIKLYM